MPTRERRLSEEDRREKEELEITRQQREELNICEAGHFTLGELMFIAFVYDEHDPDSRGRLDQIYGRVAAA